MLHIKITDTNETEGDELDRIGGLLKKLKKGTKQEGLNFVNNIKVTEYEVNADIESWTLIEALATGIEA